jgi:hypothetical protein
MSRLHYSSIYPFTVATFDVQNEQPVEVTIPVGSSAYTDDGAVLVLEWKEPNSFINIQVGYHDFIQYFAEVNI